MTDEKYTFIEDIRQKSSTAKSSHYKKTSGGKHVKFPSDYLSNKEKKKMNSEVINYNLNKPMDWKEFKSIPHDLQKEYIKKIQERFHVFHKTICSEMLNVNYRTFCTYVKRNNISSYKALDRKKKEDITGFKDWIFSKGKTPEYQHKTQKEVPVERQDITAEEPKKASFRIPNDGTFNYDSITSQELCDVLAELLKKGTNYRIRLSFYEVNSLKGESENG